MHWSQDFPPLLAGHPHLVVAGDLSVAKTESEHAVVERAQPECSVVLVWPVLP